MIKIIIDAMGSDNGSEVCVAGAADFLKTHNDTFITFVGNEIELRKWVKCYHINPEQFVIEPSLSVVSPGEGIMSLRRKKDSSMTKALRLMQNGGHDCIISSGSTAAFVAACHFTLGELPQVKRPAYMAFSPSFVSGKFFAMLDVGANLNNTAGELLQYAIMSDIYMRLVYKVKSPRVGLLNIGTEPGKGHDYQKEAYKLIQKNKKLNFVGNVESRDLLLNICDIVVFDGYTGNIFLKTYEGTAFNLLSRIKKEFHSSAINKIKGLIARSVFKTINRDFNYKKYAAAIVLGCSKLAIKTHGSVDRFSMVSAVDLAYRSSKADIITKIAAKLEG